MLTTWVKLVISDCSAFRVQRGRLVVVVAEQYTKHKVAKINVISMIEL